MDIHSMVRAFGTGLRTARSDYHLTLGQLINVLNNAPTEAPVEWLDGGSPGRERSYRGYYDDLALDPAGEPITAFDLLKRLRAALGETYEGYKGGDYVMDDKTPMWRAGYGDLGDAIVAANVVGGKVILICKAME
jgi:hypothetical protein